MKKNFKKIFTLILCIIASISTLMLANAETILESFKATSKTIKTPIGLVTDFHVIKTTDGKHVFCLQYNKKSPGSDILYTKDALITDNGMNYILNKAYNIKTDEEHYIYKSALWIYMIDKDLMEGGHKNIDKYKKDVENSNLDIAKQILEIVEEAKKAGANDTSAPTIKVSPVTTSFQKTDSTGNYFISDTITVTSSTGSYEVVLTEAPKGSEVEKNGKTFTIKVPVNSVNYSDTTVSYKVSNSKVIYTSYRYNPNNSTYQPLAATYTETKTSEATGNLTLKRTASVPFLKVDEETGEAVSGAELKVTNSAGEVVDAWTSELEEHVISGLTAGTYTLTETKAPEGYVAIETSIKFSINENGQIINEEGTQVNIIKITNKKQTTGVYISKQDITTKKELPGATLQIRDYNGNTKDEWTWVSTDKPHYIEKLEPGIYTLHEIYAPDGYVLSDEVITFTVKIDGNVEPVVMYNTPAGKDIPIPEPTGTFKSMTPTILGSLVILAGGYIVFRNYKKKENF